MASTERPTAPQKHTVVEEGSSFKGTLTSSCPIHVHGRIEGDLETPSLTVSATGVVHGKVKVGMVRSQGELAGEFDADSVELAGAVRDNTVIRARSLEVKLASTRGKLQVIFGECELAVGDEPTEHDLVPPPVLMEDSLALGAPPIPELQASASEAVAQPVAAEEEGDEPDDAMEAEGLAPPQAEGGRRRRKRHQTNGDLPRTGWSQPPSQPPPAS
ncbi:MAG TPA: polymer-forming cytoskeletal protein [Polyangiaceae bacterium]